MAHITHSARITSPVSYTAMGGKQDHIPTGPCLIERVDDKTIDIVWGSRGQSSAALPRGDVAAAVNDGRLVLLR